MAGKDDYQDFKVALNDLKMNSKPLINFLTIFAEEKMHNAPQIVRAVEERIVETRSDYILPALYVLDSIVKNLRSSVYVPLFEAKLPVLFANAFNKVDERTRSAMFKLRQTWPSFFTNLSLYNLDTRTHDIDPAWPITAKVPDPAPFLQSAHLNSTFYQRNAGLDQPSMTDDLSQQIRRLQQEDPDSNTFRTRTVIQPPISIAPPKISELTSRSDTYQMIPIERMEQIRQETAHVLDIGIDGEQQSKIRKLSGKKKKSNKKRRPSARLRRRGIALAQATANNNDAAASSDDDWDEEPHPSINNNDDDDDDDEPFIIKQSSVIVNEFDLKSNHNNTNKRINNDVETLFGGTDKDYRATDGITKISITNSNNLDADSIFEINSKCLRVAEQKYKSKELSFEEYQATLKLLQNILESEVKRLTIQNAANQINSLSTNVHTTPSHPFQQQLLQFAQQHVPQQQQSLPTFSNPQFPFSGFGNDAYRHVMQILATVGAPSSYTSSYNFLPYIPPLPPAPPSFTLVQNTYQSQTQSLTDQQTFSCPSPPLKRPYEEININSNSISHPDEDNKRPRYDPVTGRATRTRNFDEENVAPVPTLIDANINMLKKKYIGIVQQLYVGKFQCRLCGLRFTAKQKNFYTHHLDWHYLENKQEKELVTATSATLLQRSRNWYSSVQEWTVYEENIEEQIRNGKVLSVQPKSTKDTSHLVQGENIISSSGIISCPATGNGDGEDDRCCVCYDRFENFFDDNREEWHLKDAIRKDGKTYHPICYQDVQYETTSEPLPTNDLSSADSRSPSSKLDTDGNSNISCDTQTADTTTTIKTDNDDNAVDVPSSTEDSNQQTPTDSTSLYGLLKTIFVKKENMKSVENTEQLTTTNAIEEIINAETVQEEIPFLSIEPELETLVSNTSEDIRTISD